MNIPVNARVAICGYSDSGKTCLAQWMLRGWLPYKKHIFISDPLDSWPMWGRPCYYVDECAEKVQQGEKIIRLVSYDEQQVEPLCQMAADAPHCAFVMDETATFLNAQLTRCWEPFVRLTCHGRKFGQGTVALAQYYTRLPPEFRTQAFTFSSNQVEGTGRSWLKDRLRGAEPPEVKQYHWLVTAPDGTHAVMPPLNLAEIAPRAMRSEDVGGTAVPVSAPAADPLPDDGVSVPRGLFEWLPGRSEEPDSDTDDGAVRDTGS